MSRKTNSSTHCSMTLIELDLYDFPFRVPPFEYANKEMDSVKSEPEKNVLA